MLRRFASTKPINSEEVTLEGPEAHHLLHVFRAKCGEQVLLIDGTGTEFTARVVENGRQSVRLRVETSEAVSRESSMAVTLGVALPKGERQRWLIEKAVELGVKEVVPLVTVQGVSRPTCSALNRLRRAVVEATKQCGRTYYMQIGAPQTCEEFFGTPSELVGDPTLRICADSRGNPGALAPSLDLQRVYAAIGPEGGFTQDEIELARERGWAIVSLGARTLRVETAAVAIASIFGLHPPQP